MATKRVTKTAKTQVKSARVGASAAGGETGKASAPRRSRSDGQRTRSRVLQAAAEVFARDGLEGASLRRIAEAADIDIATLKYHVGDKAKLFAEVYQDGYQHFQAAVGPLLMRLPLAKNRDELERELRELFERGYDYLEGNQTFVRLWLHRLLAAPPSVVAVEERLRGEVLDLIEAAMAVLRERGLVRDVDTRLVALTLVTALPTLALGAQARPGLLGKSEHSPRERFVAFFVEVLKGYMLEVEGEGPAR